MVKNMIQLTRNKFLSIKPIKLYKKYYKVFVSIENLVINQLLKRKFPPFPGYWLQKYNKIIFLLCMTIKIHTKYYLLISLYAAIFVHIPKY